MVKPTRNKPMILTRWRIQSMDLEQPILLNVHVSYKHVNSAEEKSFFLRLYVFFLHILMLSRKCIKKEKLFSISMKNAFYSSSFSFWHFHKQMELMRKSRIAAKIAEWEGKWSNDLNLRAKTESIASKRSRENTEQFQL